MIPRVREVSASPSRSQQGADNSTNLIIRLRFRKRVVFIDQPAPAKWRDVYTTLAALFEMPIEEVRVSISDEQCLPMDPEQQVLMAPADFVRKNRVDVVLLERDLSGGWVLPELYVPTAPLVGDQTALPDALLQYLNQLKPSRQVS
jgi:hypothetical protein